MIAGTALTYTTTIYDPIQLQLSSIQHQTDYESFYFLAVLSHNLHTEVTQSSESRGVAVSQSSDQSIL